MNFQEKPSRSLDEYCAIAVRRRWWLIGPLFVFWAMGFLASHFISPKYRSETVILVEQQRIPEQYVVPNVAIDLQGRLQSMSQQILSRTRLLAIIEKFHLYRAEAAGADLEGLIARLRHDIKIEPVPGRPGELSAFKISYSSPSQQLAQQVTKELSSAFIHENLRNRQQLSENTTEFLESQLAEARTNLDEQDQRLREFKASYLGELPEQLQSNLQIFAGLQARLQAATEALGQANQQKVSLESVLAQYKTLRAEVGPQPDAAVDSPRAVQEQLDKLRAELADLRSRYTPNHPDVIRVKGQIAEAEALKRRLDEQLASRRNEDTDGLGVARSERELEAMSPMLQVQGQIKANELAIETHKREVQQLGEEIRQYQARLNTAPVREQQLAAITRDHEQARTAYESLLAKKQQSEMATDLERREAGEPFHIIDPPNLPLRPYWPDRFKLSLAGLAMGLFVALGLTALVEILDARIYREQDLNGIAPAPILAGIPPIKTPMEEKRQHRFWVAEAVAAVVLLAFIPAVTVFSYLKG